SVNLTIDYVSVSSGNLSFNQQWVSYNFNSSWFFNNIALVDINGDGYPDPVFDYSVEGDGLGYVPYYWLNNSDMSTFLQTNSAPTAMVGNTDEVSYPNIVGADFNIDGQADVAQYLGTPQGRVFFNQGSPTYYSGYQAIVDQTYLVGTPSFLTVGDVNNDGLPDLVFVSSGYAGVAFVFDQMVAPSPAGYNVQTTNSTLDLITSPSTKLTHPDFVNNQFSQINGAVYEDVNRNGRQEPNDPGLAGFTVF